jgi:hypothetical protein
MADFNGCMSGDEHLIGPPQRWLRPGAGDVHQLVRPTKATNEGEFLLKLMPFYLLCISIFWGGGNSLGTFTV